MQLLEAELAKEAGPGWGSSGRQFLYPTVDLGISYASINQYGDFMGDREIINQMGVIESI